MTINYEIYSWLVEHGQAFLKTREYAKRNPPQDDQWGNFVANDVLCLSPEKRIAFRNVLDKHGYRVIDPDGQLQSLAERTQRSQCIVCKETFADQSLLDTHLPEHNNYFKCDKCIDVSFETFGRLEKHYQIYHPVKVRQLGSSGDHVRCVVCNRMFHKSEFRLHGLQHGRRKDANSPAIGEEEKRPVAEPLIPQQVRPMPTSSSFGREMPPPIPTPAPVRRVKSENGVTSPAALIPPPQHSFMMKREEETKLSTAAAEIAAIKRRPMHLEDTDKLLCPHCDDDVARQWQSLGMHLQKYHPHLLKFRTIDALAITTREQAEALSTYWTCRLCEKPLQTYRGLMAHCKQQHPQYCYFCDHAKFPTKEASLRHMDDHCKHPMAKHRTWTKVNRTSSRTPRERGSKKSPDEEIKMMLRCPFKCNRLFRAIQGWAWHVQRKHRTHCWRCWEVFDTQGERDRHAEKCSERQRSPQKVKPTPEELAEASRPHRSRNRKRKRYSKSAREPRFDVPTKSADGARVCGIESCPTLVLSNCGYSAHARAVHPSVCWKCFRKFEDDESRRVHSDKCQDSGWTLLTKATPQQIAQKNEELSLMTSRSRNGSGKPRRRRRRDTGGFDREDPNHPRVPCLFGCDHTHLDFRGFCSHARTTTSREGHRERCWKCFVDFNSTDERDRHATGCESRYGLELFEKNMQLMKKQHLKKREEEAAAALAARSQQTSHSESGGYAGLVTSSEDSDDSDDNSDDDMYGERYTQVTRARAAAKGVSKKINVDSLRFPKRFPIPSDLPAILPTVVPPKRPKREYSDDDVDMEDRDYGYKTATNGRRNGLGKRLLPQQLSDGLPLLKRRRLASSNGQAVAPPLAISPTRERMSSLPRVMSSSNRFVDSDESSGGASDDEDDEENSPVIIGNEVRKKSDNGQVYNCRSCGMTFPYLDKELLQLHERDCTGSSDVKQE